MARASYLKEEEFNYIHLLRQKGKTVAEICKTISRSDKTVRKAIDVHTYSEYVSGNKQERKERNEREAKQRIIQQQLNVENLCPLEENNTPEEIEPTEHDSVTHNPLVEGTPAYFINRTDDAICQRIADVAIQAISALLEIHKRGRE